MLYNVDLIKKKIIDELNKDEVFRRELVVVLMNDDLIRRYLKEELIK